MKTFFSFVIVACMFVTVGMSARRTNEYLVNLKSEVEKDRAFMLDHAGKVYVALEQFSTDLDSLERKLDSAEDATNEDWATLREDIQLIKRRLKMQ